MQNAPNRVCFHTRSLHLEQLQEKRFWTSLVVQRLRIHDTIAGGMSLIPSWGTKISLLCSAAKKYIKKRKENHYVQKQAKLQIKQGDDVLKMVERLKEKRSLITLESYEEF